MGLTRREFLAASVTAAAALGIAPAASAVGSVRDRPDARTPRRVVVVGAGLAGLTAAHDLRDAGWDVVVLEARHRVGGRVHTERAAFRNGLHAEAGGESIDDNHTALQALVAKWGMRTEPRLGDRETNSVTFTRGRRRAATAYVGQRGGKVFADYNRYYDEVDTLGLHVDANHPERARGAETLDGRSLADFIDHLHLVPEARFLVEHAETGEYATEPRNLSLLFVAQQAAVVADVPDSAVETKRIHGGNDGLPIAMAAALGSSLHLATEVRRIEQHRDHVRVRTPNGHFDAAHVVLAIPPLPMRQIDFSPRLPRQVERMIDHLELGAAAKVMTQYSTRFWRAGGASGLMVTDLPFAIAWDATDSVESTGGILTTFTTGRAAEVLGRRDARSRISEVHRKVERIYPEARGASIAAATMAWRNERFTGGGYAHFQPGQFLDFWPVLRAPHGRLHFAGEHTEALAGYMESAVRSGHRVSARIVR